MAKKPAVVVPLDGSEIALKALGAAQAVAKIMDAILHVVHVAEGKISEDRLLERLKIDRLEVGTCLLKQIAGNPVEAVLGFATDIRAKMIILSTHGWTYNRAHLLGATGTGILQGAAIPVLAVRPDMKKMPHPDWQPKKMLCPINGSLSAIAGMKEIFELAGSLGTSVDVLNVAVHGGKRPTGVGTMATSEYQDYPHRDIQAWAEEFIRRCCNSKPPSVETKMFQRAGDPVKAILAFSEEHKADLIALTWQGQLEPGRAKTVKGLLKVTELPVLVTKT